MIAKHIEVLRNPKKPEEGMMTNESFYIKKNLKNSDLSEASIILDVTNGKVVKNRYTDRSFQDLYTYFVTHYSNYINRWTKDKSGNPF